MEGEHSMSAGRPWPAGALLELHPLSLAKGPASDCQQEKGRERMWALNRRLPCPTLPTGACPSSERLALTPQTPPSLLTLAAFL